MTALQPSTDETTTAPATEPTGDIQSSVREDLLSYADLGGFTLTPKTHAWYAAADTITNSEEARAASTVLAELRGRDLPATRATAARLRAETTLGELKTAATLGEAVALLHRVRTTLATLTPEVYASDDLEAFAAATADGRWRKAHGVTLSWGQRRALRRALRPFAVVPGTRRATLHAALASAASDREDWAALSPTDSLPALPEDAAILDGAIQAIEAARTGLRELDRLLPEYDLATMPFEELSDLVDQLAADEGTLYRLPTLRSLRDGIDQRGHGTLLAELATQHADAEAVAAACDLHFPARAEALQSLLPNPREDGDTATAPKAETPAPPTPVADPQPEATDTEPVAEATEPEATTEAAPEAEPTTEVKAEAAAEAEAEAEVEAEVEPTAEVEAEAEVEPAAEVEAEPTAEVEVEAEVEPAAEAETRAEVATDTEPPAEAEAAIEAVPAPEPAAPEAVAEPEAAEPTAPEAAPAAEATPEPEPTAPEPAAATAPTPNDENDEAAPTTAPAPADEAPTAPAPTDEDEAATPQAKPRRAARTRKPDVTPGRPVNAYSADELVSVVRWLDADGTDRTEDELLRAAMKELGFSRLGPRIKEALSAAVSTARS
jgi:hypothetical protein